MWFTKALAGVLVVGLALGWPNNAKAKQEDPIIGEIWTTRLLCDEVGVRTLTSSIEDSDDAGRMALQFVLSRGQCIFTPDKLDVLLVKKAFVFTDEDGDKYQVWQVKAISIRLAFDTVTWLPYVYKERSNPTNGEDHWHAEGQEV